MKTARIGKLAGALAALGLAIGAAPASAFPSWPVFGGGGFGGSFGEGFDAAGGNDGALGGDNQYAPFDGRYYVSSYGSSGNMDFAPYSTPLSEPLGPGASQRGDLTITMVLDGVAFNDSSPAGTLISPDGTDLGIFDFTITYSNTLLQTFDAPGGLGVSLSVDSTGTNAGVGLGTLFYRSDFFSGDVDGEALGDIIVFRTPECPAGSSLTCPSSFFEWSGLVGEESLAFTPTDIGKSIVDELTAPGAKIVPSAFSLFHAGLPCANGANNLGAANDGGTDFFCNPTRANFQPYDQIYNVGGITIGTTRYDTYDSFIEGHAAALAVNARLSVEVQGVPEPAIVTLLGIGLAGIGFSRRRARA